MKYTHKILLILLSYPLFNLSIAQTASFFNPKSNANQILGNKSSINANTVVSGKDFKNSVNNLTQQNKKDLSQQATQDLSKPVSLQNSPPSMPTPSGSTTVNKQVPPQPSIQPTAPEVTPLTTIPSQPSVSNPGVNPQSTVQQPPTPLIPLNQPANTGNTYTGFGGGSTTTDQNKTGAKPTDNNSGGWNINY